MLLTGRPLLTLATTLLSLAALTPGDATAQSNDKPAILETGKDGTLAPPPGLLIWRGGDPEKAEKPGYASAITPREFRLHAGQGAAELVWVYDEGAFSMPFSSDRCGEIGIDRSCTVQATLHDFDGDGRPEVVVTVGDGKTLAFWILQYFRPSAPPAYRAQRDYWSIVLDGNGLAELDLTGNRLVVPMADKGSYEYAKEGSKFVKK